ncbi:hypothetical protein Bbelb_200420 [Branchiostoma belcheri]|nr:hypothetical protein Bbelb_200420 [Branchiostoma belcheri]
MADPGSSDNEESLAGDEASTETGVHHSVVPSVRSVLSCPVLMLTATATEATVEEIISDLHLSNVEMVPVLPNSVEELAQIMRNEIAGMCQTRPSRAFPLGPLARVTNQAKCECASFQKDGLTLSNKNRDLHNRVHLHLVCGGRKGLRAFDRDRPQRLFGVRGLLQNGTSVRGKTTKQGGRRTGVSTQDPCQENSAFGEGDKSDKEGFTVMAAYRSNEVKLSGVAEPRDVRADKIVQVEVQDGRSHDGIGYGSANNMLSKAQAYGQAIKRALTDGHCMAVHVSDD